MTITIYFRKREPEVFLKEFCSKIKDISVSGRNMQIRFNSYPNEGEIKKILDALNTHKWTLVNPQKSRLKVRKKIINNEIKGLEIERELLKKRRKGKKNFRLEIENKIIQYDEL